jgi:hypothetical protein
MDLNFDSMEERKRVDKRRSGWRWREGGKEGGKEGRR